MSMERSISSSVLWFQMEVIVGDFGIVVVPRDGADTERIMNHSSILRKYKVRVNALRRAEATPPPLPHLCVCVFQDNIIVVNDAMNHPLAIVSSTKSR